MYALARSIVKNDADAADVIQDAILKAYTNLSQLRDRDKFRSWMLSIVHNTAIQCIRKRRDSGDVTEQEQLAAPQPAVDTATRLTVQQAISTLKQPYRTVVTLFYYEQYSIQQIAEITGASALAVKQQLFRGRKMLAALLKKEDFIR